MTLHSDPSLLCPNTPVQPKRGSISLVGAGPGVSRAGCIPAVVFPARFLKRTSVFSDADS